jgi:hypothetical protein
MGQVRRFTKMLQKYKEMFYGILFGFGAGIIDTFMDAWMEGLSIQDVLSSIAQCCSIASYSSYSA